MLSLYSPVFRAGYIYLSEGHSSCKIGGTRKPEPSFQVCRYISWLLVYSFLVVARAWMTGVMPLPDPERSRSHPDYKGRIIIRYWYFVVPALILVLSAFMLAVHAPNPALDPTQQNGAADINR